jgi:carbamoyltransferase
MKVRAIRAALRNQGGRSIVGLYGIGDHGVFGAPRWTHDHNAACYSESGELNWAFELERLTGIKHDNRMQQVWRETPLAALLKPDDYIVGSVTSFAGCSFQTCDGNLRIDCGPFDKDLQAPIIPARGSASADPLRMLPSWGIAQELAHPFAAAAFVGPPRLPVLLVHADGGATVSSFSAFIWSEDEIRCATANWDTVDVAMNFGFNDLFHEILGHGEDERLASAGCLMGLAAFDRSGSEDLMSWLKANSWFRNHWADPSDFSNKARSDFNWSGQLTDWRDPFVQALAGCAQRALESKILSLLRRLRESTGVSSLYAGGGIFLNIHLNAAIEASKLFDTFVVAPNASDSGLGLGAAYLLSWLRNDATKLIGVFSQFGNEERAPCSLDEVTLESVAQRLLRGQAIAVASGLAELGPRSLGHRSILCLPTPEAAARVSKKIKGREWYRPVAPIGLADHLITAYDGNLKNELVRWMLTVRRPRALAPEWSGAVHIDGTSRLQVIERGDPQQTVMTSILDRLWEKVRAPCLINTSLNKKGYPIVNSLTAATDIARDMGLDGIVVDGKAIWWSAPTATYEGAVI